MYICAKEYKITPMETIIDNTKTRKSLAVDVKTYELLQDIWSMERRSKIDQLKVLIEKEHKRLNSPGVESND